MTQTEFQSEFLRLTDCSSGEAVGGFFAPMSPILDLLGDLVRRFLDRTRAFLLGTPMVLFLAICSLVAKLMALRTSQLAAWSITVSLICGGILIREGLSAHRTLIERVCFGSAGAILLYETWLAIDTLTKGSY
jgi:hypothetical protein